MKNVCLLILLVALTVHTRGTLKAVGAICTATMDTCNGGGECRYRCCAPTENCTVFCDNSTFVPESGYTDITRRLNCNSSGLCDASLASQNLNCDYVCTPETLELNRCLPTCSTHSECWRASAEVGVRWCSYFDCQVHTAGTYCTPTQPPPECDPEYTGPPVTMGAPGRFASHFFAYAVGVFVGMVSERVLSKY